MGDTLWIPDLGNARVNFISSTMSFIGAMPLTMEMTTSAGERRGGDSSWSAVTLLGVRRRDDIAVLAQLRTGAGRDGGPVNAVLRLEPRASHAQVLALLPDDQCDSTVAQGQRRFHLRNPLCPLPAPVMEPDGGYLLIVVPLDVHGSATAIVTKRLSWDGHSIGSDTTRLEAIAISKTAIDSVRQLFSRPGTPREMAEAVEKLPFPRSVNPLRRVVAGRDGMLLVELLQADLTTKWVLFAAGGRPVGYLPLEAGERPLAVDRSILWALAEGDDGSNLLTAYAWGN